MNSDRPTLYAISGLTLIAFGALLVSAISALEGREPPAGISAVAGAAVGVLAGLIHSIRGDGQGKP